MKSSSIASRLTRRMMLIQLAAMLTIISIVLLLVWMAIAERTDNHYFDVMERTEENILRHLTNAQVATANNIFDVQANLSFADNQYEVIRHMIEHNPDIFGCGLCFVPNYYPEQGRWFEPYAMRNDSGKVVIKQIGSSNHDYLNKEWFKQVVRTRKAYWSEPYYDDAGGHNFFVSYFHPVFNSSGNMAATLGVDVSLKWLANQLKKLDDRNNRHVSKTDSAWNDAAYSFIVDKKGNYITHPDTTRLMKRIMFDKVRLDNPNDSALIIRKLSSGEKGRVEANIEDVDSYIYFKKQNISGWTLVMVVPKWMVRKPGVILLSIIATVMLLSLFVVFIVSRRSIKHITQPLLHFAASASEVAKGNFTAPLPQIDTDDEIGQLNASFHNMQHSLRQYVEQLQQTTAQKAVIDRDLFIAQELQTTMLPKPMPQRDECQLYAMLAPARQVGGDLYDYFVHDKKLFFCIGDVSGKGIPAAIIMGMTLAQFRTVAIYEQQPDRIVNAINKVLAHDNDSLMFVTLFVGVVNLETGAMTYCNAGHDAPVTLSATTVRHLDINHNIPVGLRPEWNFEKQETDLCPGTLLFLYTDGLTEAEDRNHNMFGKNNMIAVVQQAANNKNLTPRQLTDSMEQAVKSFIDEAEQSDDLTMMAIQYNGQQPPVRFKKELTLTNNINEIPQLAAFVDEACEAMQLDASSTAGMNLSLEEAVVNVMNYAWPEGTKGNILVEARADEKSLTFVIRDNGIPFNPTTTPEVDTSLPAEQRNIGGLGIHLIRHYMDTISYERTEGKNILTLTKNFAKIS